MGVPKFFRYISERYPCLSEIVKECQMPEFDNLYLDMNGIIHMCSHPDNGDPHFRISEEQIFKDIFHYIEVLFRMIKPRKLFFMAVDGVAPRAKMNQQRGRRFRTAKEMLSLEAKALERGEVLPIEARFDSNCITPGTVFMVNLHEQLKYFIVSKISTDALWRNCKVIFSGHETPGEGEHKIMDYIRYMRAQPGHDPNTRHCLYGLDADLMMLGLCTHEPHFALLREEVRFGKKSNKRKNIPEQITFYLLHLSLMREYLELEFRPLKSSLTFEYNMEKMIDDWVLMSFLVGNDFIPHLPNMHIDTGALPILYKTYMKVLPNLGGYINESGILNLPRFEKFVQELSNIDITHFSEKYADLKWFEAKRLNGRKTDDENANLENDVKYDECFKNLDEVPSVKTTKEITEWLDLIKYVPERDNGQPNSDLENSNSDSESDTETFQAEFIQHKTDYYMNKLEFENVTDEILKNQTVEYIRAIQWNLHYYYNGVCSWSWYYPHHYAPYISDIKDFSQLKLEFELGEPFKPYEQLLAVLPAASKTLLPIPYQKLMTEEDSPIKMYYPEDFKTDLNGKKMEWEAVVLIPFIEEDVLLQAMESCIRDLTVEEMKRNTHGPMLVYQYTPENMNRYVAPQYFPTVPVSHAKCETISIDAIRIPIENLIKGAYPGAKFNVYYPGFPTMRHLNYSGSLKKAKVRVFEQPSRSENMILQIINEEELPPLDAIAKKLLGTPVLVGWPHLIEALVVGISTKDFKFESTGQIGQYNVLESNNGMVSFNSEKSGITEYYQNRLGIDVGKTEVLVHVKVITGRKYVCKNNECIALEKQWANISSVYPLQTIVSGIKVHEKLYETYNKIEDLFPIGSQCFMLGQPCYGVLGEVMDSSETLKNGRIKLCMKKQDEPDLSIVRQLNNDLSVRFMNIHMASTKLAISKNLFGRITGTIYVIPQKSSEMDIKEVPRTNIGLNLKFNKKNEEIPGYSRKDRNVWYYSEKAVELVRTYMNEFPNIFEYLNFQPTKDAYEEHEMFPDGDAKEQIHQITAWIKKQPYYSIERRVCGSLVIDPEAVQLLEKVVDSFNATNIKSKQIVMQVKPHLLYKHALQIGSLVPDPCTTFELYDRVVNVREGYTVPMGYKGTIIAIHKSNTQEDSEVTFDVIFDNAFLGGLSLNGSSNRGYQMSKRSLINISHGARVLEEKSGKPGQFQHAQHHMAKNTDNNHSMDYRQNKFNQPPAYNSFQNVDFRSGPSTQTFPPTFNQMPYNPMFNAVRSGPHSFVPYKNHYALNSPPVPPPHFPVNQVSMKESKLNEMKGTFSATNQIPHSPSKNKGMFPEMWHQQQPMSQSSIVTARKANKFVLTPEDVFAHARANQQNTKQSTAENVTTEKEKDMLFNTAKVLKEFQARGLGVPVYQYFALHGQFVANITMSNGQSLVGQPAITKDQAAENAAIEALTFLHKEEKDVTTPSRVVPPQPPSKWQNPVGSPQKQWIRNREAWKTPRPENSRNYMKQESWREPTQLENWREPRQTTDKVSQQRIKANTTSSQNPAKRQQQPVVGNAFVPLQAVIQQRNRTTSASNATETVLKENANVNSAPFPPLKTNVPTAQLIDDVQKNSQTAKPKRERKMRIAANFSLASSSK